MTTDPRGHAMAARVGLAPIGSRRIEVMLASMVSVFGVLFAALTLPRFVGDLGVMHPMFGPLLAVTVYGLIAISAMAALLHQWTRPVFVVTGIVFLGALALWPVTVDQAYPGPTTAAPLIDPRDRSVLSPRLS